MSDIENIIDSLIADGLRNSKKRPEILYKALIHIHSIIRGYTNVEDQVESGSP